MAASIKDPRLEALVERVNAFDATTVVDLNNCITTAIAYTHQAIVAVWPLALADEEAAFTDLLKNIVHMADKAAVIQSLSLSSTRKRKTCKESCNKRKMAASTTDPRLEALVARVNAFDANTVVNLTNCIAAAIAYKHQVIVAVWPPALADEEAAFTDLLKNIVHMTDKAAEQVW